MPTCSIILASLIIFGFIHLLPRNVINLCNGYFHIALFTNLMKLKIWSFWFTSKLSANRSTFKYLPHYIVKPASCFYFLTRSLIHSIFLQNHWYKYWKVQMLHPCLTSWITDSRYWESYLFYNNIIIINKISYKKSVAYNIYSNRNKN